MTTFTKISAHNHIQILLQIVALIGKDCILCRILKNHPKRVISVTSL